MSEHPPTSSPLTALLVQIIGDNTSTLEVVAHAADLIALEARFNSLALKAKHHDVGRPAVFFAKLGMLFLETFKAIRAEWAERERNDDLVRVGLLLESSVERIRMTMNA